MAHGLPGQDVVERTRTWVEQFVVGLNLCPFARRVSEAGRIRYAITEAQDDDGLLASVESELIHLASSNRAAVETTILIHPRVLTKYHDYLDFLPDVDRLVNRLGLRGVVQVVSFHPFYQFRGVPENASENYTNRSPYPMLHFLREESITEVSRDESALAAIPSRNVATLRTLGLPAILARLNNSHVADG